MVYEYAHDIGLQDGSCMQYIAYNLQGRMCEAIDTCRDCTSPPPKEGEDPLANCWPVQNTVYYISDYYHVKGVD